VESGPLPAHSGQAESHHYKRKDQTQGVYKKVGGAFKKLRRPGWSG